MQTAATTITNEAALRARFAQNTQGHSTFERYAISRYNDYVAVRTAIDHEALSMDEWLAVVFPVAEQPLFFATAGSV